MIRFVIKRLLQMIPVFLGVVLIVFFINKASGDPVNMLLDLSASEEERQALRESMGLDKPFIVQYVNYVVGIVTKFDLGQSYLTKVPIKTEVLTRFPISLKLAIFSVALALIIGVPVGVISATHQYSRLDYIVTLATLILAAVPAFLFGLLLIILFSSQLKILPASGLDTWKHWILPVISLAVPPIAMLCRTTRSNMLEVIRQDYIRTARAKGLSENTVVVKHALKNALIPILTIVGIQIATVIGSSVVIEAIFTLPGVGTMIRTGVSQSDSPMILGGVVLLALTVSIVNLLVDIAYGFIDPRIRAQYASHGKKKTAAKKAAPAAQIAGGSEVDGQ